MKLRLLSLALLAGLISSASAQLVLTFNTPILIGEPGDVLLMDGTLRNPGASEVFLNGISITLGGIDLTADETPFFLDFPASLAAGEEVSGSFFEVTIANTAPPQTATGNLILSGGADSSSSDVLVDANFTVVVPEPATLAALGIGALVLLRRRPRVR